MPCGMMNVGHFTVKFEFDFIRRGNYISLLSKYPTVLKFIKVHKKAFSKAGACCIQVKNSCFILLKKKNYIHPCFTLRINVKCLEIFDNLYISKLCNHF